MQSKYFDSQNYIQFSIYFNWHQHLIDYSLISLQVLIFALSIKMITFVNFFSF